MRLLLQRVSKGQVIIDEKTVGQIDRGIVALIGIRSGDRKRDADYLLSKCVNMRIFPDELGRFDKSLLETAGDLLVISQFTLYADTRKGRRPGFSDAAMPEEAVPLYDYFIEKAQALGLKVETGEFGADMKIDIVNDGPVTIMIDSEDKYPRI